ncbi:hypothetical protein IEO21_04075 [Rhodonia placenta]|uniref:Uncharacterized protein n=1 Tax=Rhodonia placenta TaxID=104341 RepID=A0A8H7P4I6_9APHY|nr:hypothetical protein IEO21_04075 [Postia placenta]
MAGRAAYEMAVYATSTVDSAPAVFSFVRRATTPLSRRTAHPVEIDRLSPGVAPQLLFKTLVKHAGHADPVSALQPCRTLHGN